jgi:hypothetical protein
VQRRRSERLDDRMKIIVAAVIRPSVAPGTGRLFINSK